MQLGEIGLQLLVSAGWTADGTTQRDLVLCPPYLRLRSQKKGMMQSAQPMAPSADVNHGFSNVCTCRPGPSASMRSAGGNTDGMWGRTLAA